MHMANLSQAVLAALTTLLLQTPDCLHAGLPSPHAAEGIAGRAVPAPVTLRTGRAARKKEAKEVTMPGERPAYTRDAPSSTLLCAAA